MKVTIHSCSFRDLPMGTVFDFTSEQNVLAVGPWVKIRKRKYEAPCGGSVHETSALATVAYTTTTGDAK